MASMAATTVIMVIMVITAETTELSSARPVAVAAPSTPYFRAAYEAAAQATPHSHSIVPGGFEVTS